VRSLTLVGKCRNKENGFRPNSDTVTNLVCPVLVSNNFFVGSGQSHYVSKYVAVPIVWYLVYKICPCGMTRENDRGRQESERNNHVHPHQPPRDF